MRRGAAGKDGKPTHPHGGGRRGSVGAWGRRSNGRLRCQGESPWGLLSRALVVRRRVGDRCRYPRGPRQPSGQETPRAEPPRGRRAAPRRARRRTSGPPARSRHTDCVRRGRGHRRPGPRRTRHRSSRCAPRAPGAPRAAARGPTAPPPRGLGGHDAEGRPSTRRTGLRISLGAVKVTRSLVARTPGWRRSFGGPLPLARA
jgi:hypothetical protein